MTPWEFWAAVAFTLALIVAAGFAPARSRKRCPMLVLTRKPGERIVIGDGPARIEIVVTGVDRGKVRLGITAAREVPIWREELLPADPADPFAPELGGEGG
ncbi:---NA--- : Carbon storage regulator CsrA OS=Singulisphaera acidiphila (strain ATCC BAA-1392 / DSM 18658 / VKM B-2454 / MOB10) GN=Sinac_6732 PE=4 SV=1: CsrA [Gemmataceae bacterium]|nr:---NA--- : Carbon storage regulator CsrA OS=Singulisphaera acidiphila (strain ATCC BAA-1392 / DSM 18658 / VKM B-2454 / MOB10) GN=Sinac_6732 PE=4 SV=1: CsrA [Gemmataceae bacterium]VTT96528.1 ---NA--- : Carbon storage regulator CsrA OS=Singulisphaera acidiphila (strain ATCC BAA-1392 / DSM 18658 / VKM B-2454 / MOB10) GN=Sinac_6732 PE=4 SV=1: CsrA [Gemmataceae bacterium]